MMEIKQKPLFLSLLLFSCINLYFASWVFSLNIQGINQAEIVYKSEVQGNTTLSFTLFPHNSSRITVDSEEDSPERIKMQIIALKIDLDKSFYLKKDFRRDTAFGGSKPPYYYENGSFEFENTHTSQITYNVSLQTKEMETYTVDIIHNFPLTELYFSTLTAIITPMLGVPLFFLFTWKKYKQKSRYFIPSLILLADIFIWTVYSVILSILIFPFFV